MSERRERSQGQELDSDAERAVRLERAPVTRRERKVVFSAVGRASVAPVQEYYEELWERLPRDLTPPDYGVRRAFLLGELTRGEQALDVGCGEGDFTALLADAGAHAIGADIASGAIRRARTKHPGIDFRLAPIDGPLPLEDNSFELVWASEVIEHIADTARWLSEVRRVLRPGGRLLLTTPSHGRLRLALGGIERFSEPLGDHLHLYSRRSLTEVLEEFGFGRVRVRGAGGPPLVRRLLLARAVR
jgi:SAM-dependent methyltransferase